MHEGGREGGPVASSTFPGVRTVGRNPTSSLPSQGSRRAVSPHPRASRVPRALVPWVESDQRHGSSLAPTRVDLVSQADVNLPAPLKGTVAMREHPKSRTRRTPRTKAASAPDGCPTSLTRATWARSARCASSPERSEASARSPSNRRASSCSSRRRCRTP
jgi:hypothetical protein